MKQNIFKVTSDPNFILNNLKIPFTIQFDTLTNFKLTGQKVGLYILYDNYLNEIWYIGKSLSPGSTTGGIYARIKKHIERSLGTYNKTHNHPMSNWVSLENWIKTHNYPFIKNGEVASIVINKADAVHFKDSITDAENQLILYSVFYSFCNSETYHFSRFDNLSPGEGIPCKKISTLNVPIGY